MAKRILVWTQEHSWHGNLIAVLRVGSYVTGTSENTLFFFKSNYHLQEKKKGNAIRVNTPFT